MPRKTKEQNQSEKDKKETKKVASSSKKTTKKAVAAKKSMPAKKTAVKKESKTAAKTAKKPSTKKTSTTTRSKTSKAADTKTKTAATKKKAATKKTSTTAKNKTAKAADTKAKTAATKKKATATKKNTAKKVATKKAVSKKVEIVEYYDLPYRYNQTIVKLLAQTPTTLFVYWDISDQDRESFKEKYGENFFETTKPVLIVHNDTLNYSFEVEINDFANSWYLHVSDSKCNYRIELGRRPFDKNQFSNENYFYVSNSNELESPNDKILFDSLGDRVFFRDVKTGIETSKSIYNISLLKNMGKIYNIYDLYKAIYKNEDVENIYDLYNPSSGNPSSY